MQEDLVLHKARSLEDQDCINSASESGSDIDLLNCKSETDTYISNSTLPILVNRKSSQLSCCRGQNYSYDEPKITFQQSSPTNTRKIDHSRDEHCQSSSRHCYKNESCSGCQCLETFSFSNTETVRTGKREPSPPITTISEQCCWKTVDGGHHRMFSSHINGKSASVFPFRTTSSGNLKIVPKQVVFESKKVSVLVANPDNTRINVKADFDEPKKLLKSMEGEQCSWFSATKLQREEIISDSDSHCELYLQSLGFGKYEPINWSKTLLPQKSDLPSQLLHRIVNSINPDTTVHVGNEKFHCHLLVLQCYSTYFNKCCCGELKLPEKNVTPRAFATIYKWMTCAQSDSYQFLQRENILEVLNVAQFLGIKDLEDQCWSFINNKELFSEDKAFMLYLQAKKMGNIAVMELMVSRIMQFFLILVSSRDFLELSLDELCTLLQSSYICIHSEIEVFMSAVRWLMSDWDHRQKHVYEVMKCVRFGLIAPWQLVDIRRNPENPEFLEVTSFPDIQQMIEDGLAYAIIKYWYGNQTEDYYHWIDLLGLTEPCGRSWCGEPKNYVTYREFLKDLDSYREQQLLERKSRKKELQSLASQARPTLMNQSKGTGDKANPESCPSLDSVIPSAVAHCVTDQSYLGPDECKAKLPPAVEQFLTQRRTQMGPENGNCALCRAEGDFHRCSTPAKEMQPIKEKIKCSAPGKILEYGNLLHHINAKQHHQPVASNHLHEEQKSIAIEKFLEQTNNSLMPSYSSRSAIPSSMTLKINAVQGPSTLNVSKTCSSVSKEQMNVQQVANALGPVYKNYITETSLFFTDRESVLLFGGVGPLNSYNIHHSTGKAIYQYHPENDSWQLAGELPEPRHHHGVAFLKGHVYIVGGVDPRNNDKQEKSTAIDTVWSIDPVSCTWYSETSMLTARQNFGLAVSNSKLYVIGGQDKHGRILSSVERFDPRTGVWEYVAPLEVGRMGIAVAKYREFIWVAGGMSATKKAPVCQSVECYDTRRNIWVSNSPLRFPRCFSCLFVMNDNLYLVGGAGGFKKEVHNIHSVRDIDIWDSESKEWCLLTEMANARHAHTTAYLESQMLIIGGVTTDTMKALTSVERYCCQTNRWMQGIGNLPANLSGHGCVTLPPASLM